MSRIVWDAVGERIAEAGTKNGVLYPVVAGAYAAGVAWNGLTSVGEAPTGAEPTPFYADNQKYLDLMSAEEFAGTIGCYTYPEEFQAAIGEASLVAGVVATQQNHSKVGFSYRTDLVNDASGFDYGYKIHIVYGALFGVSARDHKTMNETPELEEMSFDFTATKVAVTGAKPTAHLVIDSTKVSSATLLALEDILYGTGAAAPRLPLPDEVATLFTIGAPTTLALSTIVPADAATAVVVSANTVITFNNAIASEDIIMLTAAGAIVPVVKTWDTARKVLTLDPVSNMAAATMHLVMIDHVVDIYGQLLTTVVKKFTTA